MAALCVMFESDEMILIFFFRIMVDGDIIMINEKRVQIDIKYL
jgi:hypothetical protein